MVIAWRASTLGLCTDSGATSDPKCRRRLWSARYVNDVISSNESEPVLPTMKWSERYRPA